MEVGRQLLQTQSERERDLKRESEMKTETESEEDRPKLQLVPASSGFALTIASTDELR